MSEGCLFCRIARGEIPAHEIYRNDRLVAFLDIGPIRDGHVLIITCDHYETFDDLPPEIISEITALGQRLAKIQKQLYQVNRVGFMFTGGDVAHAHAHVVPLVDKHDITSQHYIVETKLTYRTPPRPDDALLRETAAALASRLRDES